MPAKKQIQPGEKAPHKLTAAERNLVLEDILYQFKITLLESNPPIWRRIQVQNCTLDKLHEEPLARRPPNGGIIGV